VLHSKKDWPLPWISTPETQLNSNVSDDDIKFESFSPNIMRHDRDGAAGGGLLIYVRDAYILLAASWSDISDGTLSTSE
jgi:hypothetical protein